MQVDEALRAVLEDGCAVGVGTRDADLVPEVARGWGVRVRPDLESIELCIGLPSGRRTLENVKDNGRVAVTWVRPSDYRQIQFKGRVVDEGEPTADDLAWVERHREAFRDQVAGVGIAAHLCHGFWSHDDGIVKLRILLGDAYDQTPGPDAGRPL